MVPIQFLFFIVLKTESRFLNKLLKDNKNPSSNQPCKFEAYMYRFGMSPYESCVYRKVQTDTHMLYLGLGDARNRANMEIQVQSNWSLINWEALWRMPTVELYGSSLMQLLYSTSINSLSKENTLCGVFFFWWMIQFGAGKTSLSWHTNMAFHQLYKSMYKYSLVKQRLGTYQVLM